MRAYRPIGARPIRGLQGLVSLGQLQERHMAGTDYQALIGVREPVPCGVLMEVQVPAGTDFQALPW